MNQKIDPKELKVLSDILALVLEDQPGQSANALEAIKKRAKKNATTGGALKNLFTNIVNNPPPRKTSNSQSKKSNDSADLIKARSQISDLTHSINQLDSAIRNLRRQNEALRSELLLTQRSRAEMQSALSVVQEKSPFKTVLVIVSLLCGLFFGIAGTAVVNTAFNQPHQPDNTIYLH
ncbi:MULTISPECIES: hypothetical protein [Commensalibacter]|uniref:Uncharacterized protein n=2 Tax=Commensalibacter TaxID=1079922 RepID=W7DLR5_9PROT|nr:MULTISPECIES: hypothetical protein [Commensalibacter]EUK18242.1 hypothetical protein COMX_00790 [Commensalibacter papalotli (ex Servin-Garciduenas et al. 2014)]CAI3937045.1 unnamed protein product [Commensalibacter papalotli (ex Botero et al. 2024)]CAI3938569.1 unnamed protein product [Commensalibacter papalotli (ex Botero et al. 2024)]